MPVLLDLSLEILEMITMQLDVDQVLSLGFSCNILARVVGQERVWRLLLARTELEEGWYEGLGGCRGQGQVMEARVRRIYSFMTSLDNGDTILAMVHQHILEHYPPVYRGPSNDWGDCIMVSFPPSPQLHSICGIGVQLLALTGASYVVQSLRVGDISPSLLPALRGDGIVLELWGHYCDTEKEGMELVSLLRRCSSWLIKELELRKEVGGQTWAGLAREVARGSLEDLMLPRELLSRARREDLQALWEKTEWGWSVVFAVNREFVGKDPEEGGWIRLEEIIS